eukprot:CAMPEP_0185816240 /NCGR_PEP_ID=MMETSP1322-20130828/17117_1 /TAXON_ID=265543 /ORGANISM="Minutocellus polymorphus, Strain RCC2270" /LENGTH=83 /DNA_ID=CAMNT_0028513167 /DNA_START=22 /DNA_END=273 /DNA_ORIENTATION=+
MRWPVSPPPEADPMFPPNPPPIWGPLSIFGGFNLLERSIATPLPLASSPTTSVSGMEYHNNRPCMTFPALSWCHVGFVRALTT